MPPIVLSLLETRVLGVLVEKQHTVPDTYPLTLLALTAGCNQKTSRDPVMNASETDVQAALDRLKTLSFVVESSGGRVMRYAHNTDRVLAIPSQAVALVAALMLRGPQTVGELRINCDRLHRFADTSAVEGFLHELRRARQARSRSSCRASRARAKRAGRTSCPVPWPRSCSCPTRLGTAAAGPASGGELAALKADVARLEAEVADAEGNGCETLRGTGYSATLELPAASRLRGLGTPCAG